MIFSHVSQAIQREFLNIRGKYKTLEKATAHAKQLLPDEPCCLVQSYIAKKEKQPKSVIVEKVTVDLLHRHYQKKVEDRLHCHCSGKCATKKCT